MDSDSYFINLIGVCVAAFQMIGVFYLIFFPLDLLQSFFINNLNLGTDISGLLAVVIFVIVGGYSPILYRKYIKK